jgi:RNA polymerase sigma-70 factor (ECF subfamily)
LRNRDERGAGRTSTEAIDRAPATTLDPELALIKRRYAAAFAAAFRATLAGLERDARNVLRLHHVDGLSIEEVAASYGVSRATAARWLARARAQIVEEVRGRLEERLGGSVPSPNALLSLIQSQLDLSIQKHFVGGD